MNYNSIKIKMKPNEAVELTLIRRDSYYGRIREKRKFTISRRAFERALAEATLEAPWKDLLNRL